MPVAVGTLIVGPRHSLVVVLGPIPPVEKPVHAWTSPSGWVTVLSVKMSAHSDVVSVVVVVVVVGVDVSVVRSSELLLLLLLTPSGNDEEDMVLGVGAVWNPKLSEADEDDTVLEDEDRVLDVGPVWNPKLDDNVDVVGAIDDTVKPKVLLLEEENMLVVVKIHVLFRLEVVLVAVDVDSIDETIVLFTEEDGRGVAV